MKKSYLMRNLLLSACVFCSSPAFADPVQFDTESAHVIVIRPIDLWSGSERSTDYIFEGYKNKQVRYFYIDDHGNRFNGEGSMFHPMADDGILNDVAAALKPLGFVNGGSRGSIFTVEKASVLDVTEMPTLIQMQDAVFKKMVMRNGNPSQVAGKIRRKQWSSAALALVTAGIGVDKLGMGVGGRIVSSAAGQQTYQLSMELQHSLVAVPAVPFDYSQYKSVEIRKVVQGSDRMGEIIIAYKEDKTPEAEREALGKAIVAASGADTTLEAIQAAQAKDLATRQAVWDECVAANLCKDE